MARPTVITETVVSLLEQAFKDGANITQACLLANISREAYYDRVKTDEEFADKMSSAQEWVSVIARKVLKDAIDQRDKDTAKWWLERKNKKEFAQRTEMTGNEGAPLEIEVISFKDASSTD